MAYEMEVADKIEKQVESGIREALRSMRRHPRFNAEVNIAEEVNRFHKLSYKNKKYFVRHKPSEDEDGESKCYVSAQPIYFTIPESNDYTIQMEKWLHEDDWINVNITMDGWDNHTNTSSVAPFSIPEIESLLDGVRENLIRELFDTFEEAFYIRFNRGRSVAWRRVMGWRVERFIAYHSMMALAPNRVAKTTLEKTSIEFWSQMWNAYRRQTKWLSVWLKRFTYN